MPADSVFLIWIEFRVSLFCLTKSQNFTKTISDTEAKPTMDREYEEKLSHLNDLISLSKADGKESHIESGFINSMPTGSVSTVLLWSGSSRVRIKIAFSAPKTERQVIEQFHRMIILMGIDKMIYKEEVSFCFELGVKMGSELQRHYGSTSQNRCAIRPISCRLTKWRTSSRALLQLRNGIDRIKR
jgi:hypothetical protein